MTDTNSPSESYNNWEQKGLGWLPDYPDLRDYQLDKEEIQKGGRLTLEETTRNIEGLADSVINALKLLQEKSGEDPQTGEGPFKSLIEDLQSKVFGNISFLNVKLRKILRPTPKRLEDLSLSLSSPIYYQDDLWKQSVKEIKTYLYMYFLTRKYECENATASSATNPEKSDTKTADLGFYQKVVNAIEDFRDRKLYEAQKENAKEEVKERIKKEAEKLKQRILSSETKIENLKELNCAITWMKDTTFDEVTVALVQVFQHCHTVEPTGVIGSPTYHVLSKALREPTSHEKTHFQLSVLPLLKSIPSVQLIFIPSLFQPETIEAVFEGLIKICTKDLKKSQDVIKELTIFEGNFLLNKRREYGSYCEEGLGKSLFKTIDEFLAFNHPYPLQCAEAEKIRRWLLKNRRFLFTIVPIGKEEEFVSIGARDRRFLEVSYKVFNNEFKVIEPLVAVILKLVMPLAFGEYRNWFEAIAEGLSRLEKLTEKSAPPNSLCEAEDEEFLRLLLAEALQKTDQEITEGLILVREEIDNLLSDKETLEEDIKYLNIEKRSIGSIMKKEKEKKEEEIIFSDNKLNSVKARCEDKESILGATLYFYFLIKQFVRYHCQNLIANHSEFLTAYKIDLSTTTSAAEGNFFDKREVFEIENPEQFYQSDFSLNKQKDTSKNHHEDDEDGKNSKSELFPSKTLQMPVLISLPRLLGLNYLDSQTSAYFFLPGVVDLSFWCTPIEDQGALRSCAAMAGVALMEYFVNRSQGKYTDLSPLFLYKVARGQLNLTGDVGASLRETMKAMALHGVPPESVWAYNPAKVDEEPPPFCYSYAQNYQALKYFRLDYAGILPEALLFQIKAVLSASFPCMFGFTIYTSAYEESSAKQGWIPFPDAKRDKVRGGHAVVAVGYDDYKLIPRGDRTGYTLGAFLIRNCWGKAWGKGGYGWLPYDYVRKGLTYDWWSLLKAEWFESDLLGAGARGPDGIPIYLK